MIEPHWYALEWKLSCARTLESVRKAFAIDEFKLNPGPLAPLLRDSVEPASKTELNKTREELGRANEHSRSAQDKYQKQLQVCNVAERLAFSVSEKAAQDIRQELQRRRANLNTIEEAIEAVQQLIREYEVWQKTRAIPGVPSSEVTAWNELLRRLERHKQADETVCAELAARIRAITPEVLNIAAENAARQKSLLISAERGQREADILENILKAKYLGQEGFICQSEVLQFLRTKEYRLNPFNLTNAIAGLPYITARHSARLCSKMKTQVPKSTTYEMYQFTKNVWNRCGQKLRSSTFEAFEREIRKLPKFRIIDGHKRPNWCRAELARDWHYLRATLQNPELAKLHRGAVPGGIVAMYLRKRCNPESPVTPMIAEAESIKD